MAVFQGAEGMTGPTVPATPAPSPTPTVDEAGSAPAPAAGGSPDLASMTVAQLHALCEERGAKVPRKATKAQLLAALAE